MASTINASTSSGIVQTADTSGVLQLQTANTTAVNINASQNVGVGLTTLTEKFEVNGSINASTASSNNFATGNARAFMDYVPGSNTARLGQLNGASGLTTGKVSIFNNGLESIAIDATGRVTMPYQPAFYAMNTTTYSTSQIMVCGSVFVNIGSAYNSSNGRFTAPVAGTYSFSFNALKRGGAGRMLCYKNGAYYGAGASQTYSGVTTEIPQAATVVITLAVNDYVQVYLSIDAGDFYGSTNSHSGFSGQLIG